MKERSQNAVAKKPASQQLPQDCSNSKNKARDEFASHCLFSVKTCLSTTYDPAISPRGDSKQPDQTATFAALICL
jgi:hypothetical protein